MYFVDVKIESFHFSVSVGYTILLIKISVAQVNISESFSCLDTILLLLNVICYVGTMLLWFD